MQPSDGRRASGEGDIDLVGFKGVLPRHAFQLRFGAFKRLFECGARGVEARPGSRTFVRGQGAKPPTQTRKRPLLTQVGVLPLSERRQIGDLRKRRQRLVLELIQLIDQRHALLPPFNNKATHSPGTRRGPWYHPVSAESPMATPPS